MRWFALVALLSACSFDPGGTLSSTGDDVDASAATADASHAGPIDAPSSLPIDAGQITPIDATQDTSCDAPSDCPGQLCCSYAGGLATGCGDSCFGGDQVCEMETDCQASGANRCCDHAFGPSTCGSWCF